MTQPEQKRPKDIAAGLLAASVTMLLLLLHPTGVASRRLADLAQLVGALASEFALFICLWRLYGCFYGFVAAVLFIFLEVNSQHSEQNLLAAQISVFLASAAMCLMVGSNLDRGRMTWPFFLFATLAQITFSTIAWLCAAFATASGATEAAVPRVAFAANGLIWSGAFMAILNRQFSGVRILWCAVSLAAPLAGCLLAQQQVSFSIQELLQAGRWPELPRELAAIFTTTASAARATPWLQPWPWLGLSLMALGTWRLLSRGFRQRHMKDTPTAWFIALAAHLLGLLALTTMTAEQALLPLGWVGLLLSVAGVADILLALFQQLVLPLPESDPRLITK